MSRPNKLRELPNRPGVYLFKGRHGAVIYVGKAKQLRRRVASYFNRPRDLKNKVLTEQLTDLDYIVTASELDALILEAELIKKYRPRYNVSLRDDKSYPYLKLTINEEWPRLFLTRRKAQDGALYFGRFQSAMVREIVKLVKKLFPIRWCRESPLKKRAQPCLYYRLGSCSAPCVGQLSRENYLALVKGTILLLEGEMGGALEQLKSEMTKAAAAQDYERAAYLRDRIKVLRKLMETKELRREAAPRLLSELNELQEALNLPHLPMRIEAFDISNLSGANMVGALVAFYGGQPLKSDYRRFQIRSVAGKPNDAAALAEVVRRRYHGTLAQQLPLPDLILIDGGRPQVGAAVAALGSVPAALVGLAKREEELYLPRQARPLKLPRTSPAIQLLQRIRDEVHRFAVTYHRHKRNRALYR